MLAFYCCQALGRFSRDRIEFYIEESKFSAKLTRTEVSAGVVRYNVGGQDSCPFNNYWRPTRSPLLSHCAIVDHVDIALPHRRHVIRWNCRSFTRKYTRCGWMRHHCVFKYSRMLLSETKGSTFILSLFQQVDCPAGDGIWVCLPHKVVKLDITMMAVPTVYMT